ncbi:MAG: CBS domain-containing protein [Litoreibacter sp.]|nr:CBS domain-containing protein [Litoreibacter sp.]
MDVCEAMHKTVDWVSPDTSVAEIAELMRKDDVGAIPVCKGEDIVGMVTDRDIALGVVAEGKDPKKTKAHSVMTKGVVYCKSHQTVEDAIHLMDQKKIRRLPVLNDENHLVGMLSVGDISHAVSRELAGELIHAVSDHHP